MAYCFPEFPHHVPLDATRSWTAVFDSFDERNSDIYYIVTVYTDGKPTSRFVA